MIQFQLSHTLKNWQVPGSCPACWQFTHPFPSSSPLHLIFLFRHRWHYVLGQPWWLLAQVRPEKNSHRESNTSPGGTVCSVFRRVMRGRLWMIRRYVRSWMCLNLDDGATGAPVWVQVLISAVVPTSHISSREWFGKAAKLGDPVSRQMWVEMFSVWHTKIGFKQLRFLTQAKHRNSNDDRTNGGKEINSIYCTLVDEAGWLFIFD